MTQSEFVREHLRAALLHNRIFTKYEMTVELKSFGITVDSSTVASRLRDLRMYKYGGMDIQKSKRSKGVFEYYLPQKNKSGGKI